MEKNIQYEHNLMGGQDVFRVGICDDEKTTCAEIEEIIYECGKELGVQFDVSVWYQGEMLCDYLKNDSLEILFLDIELLSTDGIKVGKYIRDVLDNPNMMIVYISSKSSYAMNLFKVQPLDFLIKPIKQADVLEVLQKAVKIYRKKNQSFECSSKGCRYKVAFKDIIYFYSQNKKVIIVTNSGNIEFNEKLKKVAEEVPANFLQIHQSFLVNMDYVAECTYEEMKMQNGMILTISQPYRKKVRDELMKKRWEI